jgi:hypothetical protein
MNPSDLDSLIRAQAFEFLADLTDRHGDVLPIEPLR